MCQIAGDARHVGLGTDFDGGQGAECAPIGIETVADLPLIAPALERRGYHGKRHRRHPPRELAPCPPSSAAGIAHLGFGQMVLLELLKLPQLDNKRAVLIDQLAIRVGLTLVHVTDHIPMQGRGIPSADIGK